MNVGNIDIILNTLTTVHKDAYASLIENSFLFSSLSLGEKGP